jgi:hypothetical protein
MCAKQSHLLAALLALYCVATQAQGNSFAHEGRDPGVERWISYAIVGPSDSPYPFVYLTTHPFTSMRNEFVTVLADSRFDSVSEYTRARIARDDCPGTYPQSNLIWYSVKITLRDGGQTQYCILPRKATCEFLNAVTQHVEESWTADERRDLAMFGSAIYCDAKATH